MPVVEDTTGSTAAGTAAQPAIRVTRSQSARLLADQQRQQSSQAAEQQQRSQSPSHAELPPDARVASPAEGFSASPPRHMSPSAASRQGDFTLEGEPMPPAPPKPAARELAGDEDAHRSGSHVGLMGAHTAGAGQGRPAASHLGPQQPTTEDFLVEGESSPYPTSPAAGSGEGTPWMSTRSQPDPGSAVATVSQLRSGAHQVQASDAAEDPVGLGRRLDDVVAMLQVMMSGLTKVDQRTADNRQETAELRLEVQQSRACTEEGALAIQASLQHQLQLSSQRVTAQIEATEARGEQRFLQLQERQQAAEDRVEQRLEQRLHEVQQQHRAETEELRHQLQLLQQQLQGQQVSLQPTHTQGCDPLDAAAAAHSSSGMMLAAQVEAAAPLRGSTSSTGEWGLESLSPAQEREQLLQHQ